MAVETLSELRHVCKLCGGSCQGTFVRLLGDEEQRVRHVATLLGVEEPVVSGRLRLDAGRCVFLGDDDLCRIHAAYGAEAKPKVCRQYPVIAVRVGDDVRVGLDPGCYTSITTWRDGPLVPDGPLVATPVHLGPMQEPDEDRLLDLLDIPDIRVAQVVGAVVGEEPGPEGGLPPGFASRLVTRLQAANLEPLLEGRDTAPMLRRSLDGVAAAIRGWDPAAPPRWPAIGPEAEAFALDALRRMLWLRLGHAIPLVSAVALHTLGGIVACGWGTADDAAFGRALAAWCRALRAEVFWRAITPDATALSWLAGEKA